MDIDKFIKFFFMAPRPKGKVAELEAKLARVNKNNIKLRKEIKRLEKRFNLPDVKGSVCKHQYNRYDIGCRLSGGCCTIPCPDWEKAKGKTKDVNWKMCISQMLHLDPKGEYIRVKGVKYGMDMESKN